MFLKLNGVSDKNFSPSRLQYIADRDFRGKIKNLTQNFKANN